MVQCPNCARKFLEDRLVVHLRSCTSENPCKPVRPITPVKEEPLKTQTNPIPITSQSMNFKPSRVVASNSGSFQGNPTKQSILDKYMSESKLKTQEINEIPEVKNSEIPRSVNKGAEIEESEIKSIEETLRQSTLRSKEISQILRPKSIQGSLEETKVGVKPANQAPYEFQPEEDSRVPCSKCGRKFNPDRVAKHEEICKADAEIEYKKPKEEAKVYSKSPEPARSTTPKPKKGEETVECPYCTRNFDPKVAERHIPKCKDIVNRPSPPAQKTKSVSQSVIINKPALLGNSNTPAKNPEFRQTERPFRDSAEKIFCHNCGERYYPNSKFCSFCGEKK